MATVSTSQNLTAVVYIAGEDITITNGATLTVDSTPALNPGNILNITEGILRVENSSTTTPIVLTLSANTKDFRNEKNGQMIVRGVMINAKTGNGTASQTLDLSVAPYTTIPYPSLVEIETVAGNGIYKPLQVICTTGKTITYPAANFSTGDAGDVVFWNATTRILTFGDGTNGNILGNGVNVRIPNIYIHSASNNATQGSRTLVDLNPSGILDAECCAFSDAIYFSNTTFANLRMSHVGVVSTFTAQSANADLELEYFAVNHDTQQNTAGNGLVTTNITGDSRLYRITAVASIATAPASAVHNIQLIGLSQLDYAVFGVFARSANGVRFMLEGASLSTITDVVAIGCEMRFTTCSNIDIINARTAENFGTSQSTANAQSAFNIIGSKNLTFISPTNAGIASHRTSFFATDGATTDINVFNATLDGKSNCTSICSPSGNTINFYNSNFSNMTTGPIIDLPTTFLGNGVKAKNCRATWTGTLSCDAAVDGEYDGIAGNAAQFNTTFSAAPSFNSALLLATSLTPTAGEVVFASFGADARNVVTGDALLDNAGLVELPSSGDTLTSESLTFHGITSFQNVAPVFTYIEGGVTSTNTTTVPSTMTVEFAVANPGGTYSSFSTLNAGNLSTALSSLSGYDSDTGVTIKIKVTTTSADSTRKFYKVYWNINYDSAYSTLDSFVNIAGAAVTDVTTLYRSSDNAVLGSITGSGTINFSATYGTGMYAVRRTSGAVEIMRTESNPVTMSFGDNGTINVYAGDEVQIATNETAANIADAVWTENLSSYSTSNTAGLLMKKASKPKISL